jgi:hypothetical protein
LGKGRKRSIAKMSRRKAQARKKLKLKNLIAASKQKAE